jgi:6-phosphofructokinase
MSASSKTRCIGLLTSGGDCPGLNAAIRAITRAAIHAYGIKVIGILDGFRGLVENRTVPLDDESVSGILTRGGTILGTSRDKPHKMPMGGKILDMTETTVQNARRLEIDCLVCLGGGGTQKNAQRMARAGLRVLTLPKTIDNDVPETDFSFGFDTAMGIATEAVDRLHTTATSHHRIIVCEIMGHRAGWLTLGAGLAGGADVILIPELPYDLGVVARYLLERRRSGKRFSIVAVSEGARSKAEVEAARRLEKSKDKPRVRKPTKGGGHVDDAPWRDETREGQPLVVRKVRDELQAYHVVQEPMASRVARQLQELTGVEARVTSLGHVLRGGIPSAFDRMLCTLLGTKAAELMAQGTYNVMVAYRGEACRPVPLEQVAGGRKEVPPDHPMVRSARLVGTCLGDR